MMTLSLCDHDDDAGDDCCVDDDDGSDGDDYDGDFSQRLQRVAGFA